MHKFTLSQSEMSRAFNIDMASLGKGHAGTGFSFGRVTPGGTSELHRHDESEAFIFLSGSGTIRTDRGETPVQAGDVLLFDPFESHVIYNDGEEDLNFVDIYWRDNQAALEHAKNSPASEGPVFIFSTPPTPNGDLHLGHLSGPYFGADVYKRFLRAKGVEAYHLTGSDDYQSYVASRAAADGTTSAEVARSFAAEIRATLALLDCEVDSFLPTIEDRDYATFQAECFRRLLESPLVDQRESAALFDADTGAYLYEPDVSGICPDCGSSAGGNICEECGAPNLCHDLVEPRSKHSSLTPVVAHCVRVELQLDSCYDQIDRHLRASGAPVRIMDLFARLREQGAFSVPITHQSNWGIPSKIIPDQVIWVWPEMAFGFLYNIATLARTKGWHWSPDRPSNDTRIVHFFGFDNSFYHAILYPALYAQAFPDWTPNIRYHVNEFYLLDGKKFSTSRRHAVWGKEVLNEKTVDIVRLHLGLSRPEGVRTNFTLNALRHTEEAIFRGTWLVWLGALNEEITQKFGGRVPDAGDWITADKAFLARLEDYRTSMEAAYGDQGFSIRRAASLACDFVSMCAEYAKANDFAAAHRLYPSRHRTSLALQATAAALLARTLAPLMPRFAEGLGNGIAGVSSDLWPTSIERLPPGTAFNLRPLLVFYAPAVEAFYNEVETQ